MIGRIVQREIESPHAVVNSHDAAVSEADVVSHPVWDRDF
jgi:hypothetical protein